MKAFTKAIDPVLKTYGLNYSLEPTNEVKIWCPECNLDKYCGYTPAIKEHETE